ncbi:MAG: lipoyl synthase [Bacteroidetes bacterium]|nr:lipoyl synthase [Bacteroidota bacterium]
MENKRRRQKPDWLKIKVPSGKEYTQVKDIVNKHKLHTICSSGQCPNMCDCWGRGTATLMILGDICTRSCKFCAVKTGKPLAADLEEPARVADSVKLMKLKHVVLTSVDRDDLEDGGAGIWAATIRKIKEISPDTTQECLVPDFMGKEKDIQTVIDAKPEVISHNLETVERLTPQIRSVANYKRSLKVIEQIAGSGLRAKSGIMLGLGETEEEVIQCMDDLRAVGCHIFTLGQYLQPSIKHLPVVEYIHPDQFEKYRKIGLEKGFTHVESDPLVRSSYHAEKHVK